MVYCENIWKRRGKPEKVRSCFLPCSKFTYREFLATRTAQRTYVFFRSDDLVRLGTRRIVPSQTAVTWLALFGTNYVVLGHMLIFWEYSSSSREKKVEYLLVYRIVNYRGFVLFRAFLRYIVGHLLLFSLFRCFREPVVMSAVHLGFFQSEHLTSYQF